MMDALMRENSMRKTLLRPAHRPRSRLFADSTVQIRIEGSRTLQRGDAKNLIAVDILRVKDGVFMEHWDVLQDEVSNADSQSGLPIFGIDFSY